MQVTGTSSSCLSPTLYTAQFRPPNGLVSRVCTSNLISLTTTFMWSNLRGIEAGLTRCQTW